MTLHPSDDDLIAHAFSLLEEAPAAGLAAHLAACPACRARQAQLQERLSQLALLSEPIAAPEPLIADTLRAIRQVQAAAAPPPWYYRWGILTTAAAATLLVLVSLPIVTRWGRPPQDIAAKPPAPAPRVGGIEVNLVQEEAPLDPLDPLPDGGLRRPELIDGRATVRELAAGETPTPALPGPARVGTSAIPHIAVVPRAEWPNGTPPHRAQPLPADGSRGYVIDPATAAAGPSGGASAGRPAPPDGNATHIPAPPRLIRFALPADGEHGLAGPRDELEYLTGLDGLRLRNRTDASFRIQVEGAGDGIIILLPGAETNLARRVNASPN